MSARTGEIDETYLNTKIDQNSLEYAIPVCE